MGERRLGEPRYTEAEWRAREAERLCADRGHDWVITESGDGNPVAVHCSVCQIAFGVVAKVAKP